MILLSLETRGRCMMSTSYHELDSSTPGVCVVSDDGKLTWSSVKITRSCVKE